MLKHYEGLITKEFLKHFNGDKEAFSTGKNLLSYKMALELTERILKQEQKFLQQQTEPVFIEYLEMELHADMEIEIQGKKKTLHFKGFMDRVDSIGGRVRIIDYKSGKVKSDDVTISEIKDEERLIHYFGKTKHAVQLIMYCYLYQQNYGSLPAEASIYSLINISEGTFPLQSKKHSVEEIVELFPKFIQQLFEEMYDEEIPFEHATKGFANYCLYCD
jgi:ATP-dependent exoDNAse (exonuclease V) beta subunit